MTSAAALRALYRVMPDRTVVTFRDQTRLGVYADSAVGNAWRRPSEVSEGAPSLGVYTKALQDWFFPQGETDATPTPGDLVQWDNPRTGATENWTVLSVGEVGALGAWRLNCIELALQHGLSGLAWVTRPNNAKGAAGRQSLVAYSEVAANVPCRIQPTDNTAQDVFDRRTTPDVATCYLGYTIDAAAKDRLRDDAGQFWSVLASHAPSQLGELFSLDLERIP